MVRVEVRAWTILFFLILIPSSCGRPHKKQLADELENALLKILSDVKSDESDLLERDVKGSSLKKRTQTDTKTTFTKEEIDTLKVDPNSNLENLLETMLDNGHQAQGIHPDQKDSVKGMKLEEKHEMQNNTNRKRNFIMKKQDPPNYWPNAEVPFYVDYSMFDQFLDGGDAETVFQSAIADFEEHTCIKLIRKTEQELVDEDINHYVKVTADKNGGCYSAVGLQSEYDGPQELNIGEGCVTKSIVLHEFCHAIGMQHEQSRNDRDKHVKVHFDNIEAKNKYNLAKEKTVDKNPYDYFSIMQYELQSFTSKSWAKAMSFVDPDLEFLAGLSKELTFYDIMDITKAYQCNDHCQNNLRCINGGFVNHKCECFCPEGLSGKYCELINCDTCGGVIELKPGDPVYVTSPNYPDKYNTGEICYWLLRAQNTKQRIVVEIEDFEIPSNEYNRCYHWLEIRYNLIGQPGYKLCDNKVSRTKITSTQYGNPDLMMLIFDTKTITGVEPSKGFRIKAQAYNVNPYDKCQEDPPLVDNAEEDSVQVGTQIGVAVTYTCMHGYRMVGQNTIWCEGDAKWTKIRFHCVKKVIVFEYNFDDDDVSLHGIKVESNTEDKWAIGEEQATYDHYGNYDQQDTYDQQYFYGHKIEQHETYDGYGPPFDTYDAEKNRYITTKTHGSNNPTYTSFILPIQLQSGTTYCLSFHFRRHTQVEECAVLHIGDIKDRWSYSGCEKSGWKLFEGTYGPDDFDNYPIYFFAASNGNLGKLNIDIDDIIVSEGTC